MDLKIRPTSLTRLKTRKPSPSLVTAVASPFQTLKRSFIPLLQAPPNRPHGCNHLRWSFTTTKTPPTTPQIPIEVHPLTFSSIFANPSSLSPMSPDPDHHSGTISNTTYEAKTTTLEPFLHSLIFPQRYRILLTQQHLYRFRKHHHYGLSSITSTTSRSPCFLRIAIYLPSSIHDLL